MDFHKKLREFFEEKRISNRELAKRINYSEVMVGRYLRESKPNYEFLKSIKKAFPDLDLNYLFNEETMSHLEEDTPIYSKTPIILIDEIEVRLKYLKDSCHKYDTTNL